jgi:signal transduction histidine kinase
LLAQGLHPRVLSERGLEGALESLAERSPVPVTVAVAGDGIPLQVEAAVYFVCSEALANVAKYASASKVAMSVSK